MAREWQQTRFREYVMPEGVYYQSLWAVRDLKRMEERARELQRDIDGGAVKGAGLVRESRRTFSSVRPTEDLVMEKALLEARIGAIRGALAGVPEKYRDMILENIIEKTPASYFSDKVWKIWKQRFIFQVAKNLSLM